MTRCPICDGTGQLPDIDRHVTTEFKLQTDPELRAFMEQTDLRSEEERMMQYLHPRLFHEDAAFMIIESHPARKHAPAELKEPPAPERHPDCRIPEFHAPVRTGGDVIREAKERGIGIIKEESPMPRSRIDPLAATKRMNEAMKDLGF